jgi:parallel beta-helix repeat protein
MRERLLQLTLLTAIGLLAAAAPASAQTLTCGQVITQDTTLESDMTCYDSPSNIGVVIGAPGITFDLAGHSIRTTGSAVVNEGHHDVTIRNGTVSGEEGAVRLTGVKRNLIEDMDFVRGTLYGVRAFNSDRNRIVSSDFAAMGVSLLDGSDRNVVAGNSIEGYEGFISMSSSNDNRVLDNVLHGGEGPKISAFQSHGTRIARNHVLVSDVDVAIALGSSHHTEVVDNVTGFIPGPFGVGGGLRIAASNYTLVRGNIFARATPGLLVQSAAGTVVRGNLAFLGESDGFVVEQGTSDTLLENNDAVSNADDGFDIRTSSATLTGNTADDNGDLGIEAVNGVIDGGGNSASGNGNPLQCVNVFCAP